MAKLLKAISRTGVAVISLALFAVSALSLWQSVYYLCNLVGAYASHAPYQALAELGRVFPAMLASCVFAGLSLGVFNIYRSANPERRRARARRQGAALLICGTILVIYIPVGRLAGAYSAFVEGYPSALFPLNLLILGVVFLLAGLVLWFFSGRLTSVTCNLPGRCSVGAVFCYVVGCCAAAGCFWGIIAMDWRHGGLLFNTALWLNYFAAALNVLLYRFVYAEAAPEKRNALGVKLARAMLFVNAALLVYYALAVLVENEAPNANAVAVMPLENFSSMHLFLPIFAVNNLLGPLVALLRCGIRHRKDLKQVPPPPAQEPAPKPEAQETPEKSGDSGSLAETAEKTRD